MNHADKLHPDACPPPATDTGTPHTIPDGSPAAEGAEVALERVLLYLKALKAPCDQRLAVALEAFKRSGPHNAATAAVLRSARELLIKQRSPFIDGIVSGTFYTNTITDRLLSIQSMPPLNRGVMLVDKSEASVVCYEPASPLVRAVKNVIVKAKPLFHPLLFLLNLVILLILFWVVLSVH